MYFMDSNNLEYLQHPDRNIPRLYNHRLRERVNAGVKIPIKFTMQMSIQSIFDIRRCLIIMQDVFLSPYITRPDGYTRNTILQKYYAQV